MIICDYGCNQEAKYKFKNGKWCCSKHSSSCPYVLKKNKQSNKETFKNPIVRKKISDGMKGNIPWNKGKIGIYSEETLQKMREAKKGIYDGENNPMFGKVGYWKDKQRPYHSLIMTGRVSPLKGKKNIKKRLTIKEWRKKYPLFSKVEEMRYNPKKPEEKEIQVHCKNHNCPNSKEQGGWFTPTRVQFQERLRNLEINGLDNSYFYCSDECKNECPLYNLRSDPYKKTEEYYTDEEYQTFRKFVLKRDNYKCQYCGEEANHVHHERPQKLEPFFSLDLDFAWSCCEKCHYEKGHKDECSTGNLANKICIGESLRK